MSKRKLLLADDSVTIQKVVNLTFTDEGFEVFTVGSGTAAMNMIGSVKPDLVLADVHMPGLTGYEVCEKIRQKPEFENLPVILLVGSFEPFDETEAERVGANDFLTKPFQSIRQLVQKVVALLDAPASNGQAAIVSSASSEQTDNISAEQISVESADSAAIDAGDLTTDDENDGETIEITSGDQLAAKQSNGFDLNDTANRAADDSFENRPTAPLSFADAENANALFAENQMPTETAESETFVSELESFNADSSEAETIDLNMNDLQNNIFPESNDLPFGEMPEAALALEPSAQNFEIVGGQSDDQTVNFISADSTAASRAPAIDLPRFEIDFDDDSLLELEEEVETIEPTANTQTEAQSAAVEVMPAQNFAESDKLMQAATSAMSNQNLPFSPEMIDAIAQRVVEKLSDKVIEKIAWEIVPDRFDLIVRKHIDGRER